MSLKIVETLTSIHGEHPFIGAPCTIVRLQGCNLKCSYCDTKHSIPLVGGKEESVDDIRDFILEQGLKDLLITGGEPLLQSEEVCNLIISLPISVRVTIETNGTVPIDRWLFENPNTYMVLDYKTVRLTPEQKEVQHMNLRELTRYKGALKFLVEEPFDEIKSQKILKHLRFFSSFSSVYLIVSFTNKTFAPSWIPFLIEASKGSRAELRVQLQLHKILEVA